MTVMKRHIPYIIIAAALPFLSLWSCTRVEMQEEDSRTGYLYVSLDRDDSEEIVFKSVEEAETPFILKIYNELDQLVETIEDHRTLADTPLVLKVGTYTVVASSAEESAAAQFDAPFYSGSAEFEASDGSIMTHSWFIGFSNVEDPDLVVAVIAEGAGTGSSVAVPIAHAIFNTYYYG